MIAPAEVRQRSGAFYRAYAAIRRLNGAAIAVASGMIVLMVILTDWGVITRYFLRDPATWTYPVTTYLLLYSTYLALAYTLQKGGHVGVEFVVEMLPPPARRWMDRLGHILGAGFTALFLYETWRLFTRHLKEGQRDISMLSTPLWILTLGLVLGLALMLATYVFVLVDSFLTPAGAETVQNREGLGSRVDELAE